MNSRTVVLCIVCALVLTGIGVLAVPRLLRKLHAEDESLL